MCINEGCCVSAKFKELVTLPHAVFTTERNGYIYFEFGFVDHHLSQWQIPVPYGSKLTSQNSPAEIPNQALSEAMENTPKMDWTSNNFWVEHLQLFFKVRKVCEADQVSHILLQAGKEGLCCFNSWTLTEEEEAEPTIILQKFKEQLEPAENYCDWSSCLWEWVTGWFCKPRNAAGPEFHSEGSAAH